MKTTLNMLLAATVFLLFSSMKGGEPKPYKNASRWIPADFDVRKSTLLVQYFMDDELSHPKVNPAMKAYMKQAYPYKFEMVTTKMLANGKFADKDMYRYVLMADNYMTNGSAYGTLQSSGTVGGASNKFHIYDRKLDAHYPDTFYGHGYVIPSLKRTLATIIAHQKALKK